MGASPSTLALRAPRVRFIPAPRDEGDEVLRRPPGQGPALARDIARLGLPPPVVDALYSVFCRADASGAGALDAESFARLLNGEGSAAPPPGCDGALAARLFALLDVRGSGRLFFHAFLLGIWEHAALLDTQPPLVRFTFALFDLAGRG
jgi:hypothetical protein